LNVYSLYLLGKYIEDKNIYKANTYKKSRDFKKEKKGGGKKKI